MAKSEKTGGRQREFLFVFSSGYPDDKDLFLVDGHRTLDRESTLDDERVKLLKRRLITELRELGC